MKKNILAVVLLICMSIGLVGCGGSNSGAEDKGQSNGGLSNGLVQQEKDKVPVKVADALKSSEFEFIYNYDEVPESYWKDTANAATFLESYEDKIGAANAILGSRVIDVDIDCVGKRNMRKDLELSEPFTISLKGNELLLYSKLHRLNLDDDSVHFYVMGNDFKLYYVFLSLEFIEDADYGVELKDLEWVYTNKNSYAYKISEKLAIELVLPEYDHISSEKSKELGDYLLTLITIQPKEDAGENAKYYVTIHENYNLGNGMVLNLADKMIGEMYFNDYNKDKIGIRPMILIANEKGETIFIKEYSSLEAYEWDMNDMTWEEYDENIKLTKYSDGRYADVVFEIEGRIITLGPNLAPKLGTTAEDFVNSTLESIITFNE